MAELVRFEKIDSLGVVQIDNPPVNSLSPEVIEELVAAYTRFSASLDLEALLIYGGGSTFVAGGDIASFDAPGFTTETYNRFLRDIENSPRPVIACFHRRPTHTS